MLVVCGSSSVQFSSVLARNIYLLESDEKRQLVLNEPSGFFNLDVMFQLLVNDGWLVLDPHEQVILLDVDRQVSGT